MALKKMYYMYTVGIKKAAAEALAAGVMNGSLKLTLSI